MSLNILLEASGSLVSSFMIDAIQRCGHRAIASDISTECVGRYLADDFIEVPTADSRDLWPHMERLLVEHRVDVVIPSLDETLADWASRKPEFSKKGISVCLSDEEVIRTFGDKWAAYLFFRSHGIPTPDTSLEQHYPLVKPRLGRGGVGVRVANETIDMTGFISQEQVSGTEYTVDVLCSPDGSPIYIVPRRRLGIRDGKSTGGVVERELTVIDTVRRLCAATHFIGPINVQCFVRPDSSVSVIEVNPRIAGGLALGFAATENWIPLLCRMLRAGEVPEGGSVKYGMRMLRHYAEVFVSAD